MKKSILKTLVFTLFLFSTEKVISQNSETLEPNCFLRNFWKLLAYNVSRLKNVAKTNTKPLQI